jgi:hypothetical protein
MNICSREYDEPAGEGEFTLRMTVEELQVISAMLYVTRLGPGTYQRASMKLMGTIEQITDKDFQARAADDVDLHVTQVDDSERTVAILNRYQIILEV